LYHRITFFGVRAITHRRPKRRNKSGPQVSILAPGNARLQLQTTVDMLNASTARDPHWLNDSHWEWRDTDITEAQQELRRLIAKWNRSGPNLLKLFKENPDLQASCTEGTTMLIPNTDGVAQLAWFPRAVGHKNVAKGCCPFSLHPVPGEFPCADTRRSPVGVVASSMSRTPNARKQIARVGAEPPVRL
jgi:hypothetical protein